MIALVAVLAVKAVVSQVTVYGDRARVERAAELAVDGETVAELPLLPETVDASSIRVEAAGAEVRKVDIEHVEPDEFPAGEARELLGKLERLDDQLALLLDEHQQEEQQLGELRKIAPAIPEEPLKPRPKLNARGWSEALSFAADEEQALRARLRDAEQRQAALRREREPLAQRALIIGGAGRRAGWRVRAELAGRGAAHLKITYLASRARWTPTYDLQLLSDQKTLRIAFSGAATQETGEDWENAALTLSTAAPASVRALPEIATWKIGEKERFVPTPLRQGYPQPPAPPPAPAPLEPKVDASAQLRQQLVARASAAPGGVTGGAVEGAADGQVAQKPQEVPQKVARKRPVTAAPPALAMPAPAQPPMMAMEPAPQRVEEEVVVTGSRMRQGIEASAQLGIAPPPAWRPPPRPPDSPAALAGGYDLEFPSARRETLKSGGGARRVLLFSETWPVRTERLLVPAISPEAYLVAQIKNPSLLTLPAGQAQLAVGADPAGTAALKLVAPGEEVTLPLGVDRAVRSFRNVEQVQAEKGFFSKDDVTRYAVTIEVQNPYPTAVPLRIVDELPLQGDKNIEVAVVDAAGAERDAATGKLTWRVTAPPSGTAKIVFQYELKRPKGYRVHQ